MGFADTLCKTLGCTWELSTVREHNKQPCCLVTVSAAWRRRPSPAEVELAQFSRIWGFASGDLEVLCLRLSFFHNSWILLLLLATFSDCMATISPVIWKYAVKQFKKISSRVVYTCPCPLLNWYGTDNVPHFRDDSQSSKASAVLYPRLRVPSDVLAPLRNSTPEELRVLNALVSSGQICATGLKKQTKQNKRTQWNHLQKRSTFSGSICEKVVFWLLATRQTREPALRQTSVLTLMLRFKL